MPTLVIRLVQVLNVSYGIVLQVPQQHVHQVIVVMERNLLPVQFYLLPLEKFFLVIIVCINYLVNVVKSQY